MQERITEYSSVKFVDFVFWALRAIVAVGLFWFVIKVIL